MTEGRTNTSPKAMEGIPVLFHTDRELTADSYCCGIGATADRFWDGEKGWRPCVMIELGEVL